jgi:ABC-2 type transport system ATP-binding protein
MSKSTGDNEFAVEVRGLSRSFRGTNALLDVDLRIPTGSIFGLIGVNGAGKTTLIRHLIGALRAQAGTVRVLGQDPIADPEGVLREIGYLSEEDSLPTWMKVGELIDFCRALYPTWDDAYASELCDMFGLTRATALKGLSKGQRARAGLLVAIAHRPKILILDEPSSGLDPIARHDILEAIIRTINQDGRTVLFSSHLLDEVDRVCDSIAMMRGGRIIQTQTTEQIEDRYREIICRPSDPWSSAPATTGILGWQRLDREWSAVIDTSQIDPQSPMLAGELSVIETRDISLARWFDAHAKDNRDEVPENA